MCINLQRAQTIKVKSISKEFIEQTIDYPQTASKGRKLSHEHPAGTSEISDGNRDITNF